MMVLRHPPKSGVTTGDQLQNCFRRYVCYYSRDLGRIFRLGFELEGGGDALRSHQIMKRIVFRQI